MGTLADTIKNYTFLCQRVENLLDEAKVSRYGEICTISRTNILKFFPEVYNDPDSEHEINYLIIKIGNERGRFGIVGNREIVFN